MTLDEHYICQRAANAIISEIGPYRVSTDALQAINQFLDEFIVLLLTCSMSLDLSQIKSVVVSLLPSSLGKNAIVEAEIEVKTFTETESIDYDLYERMRNLTEKEFPLGEAVSLLREKCFEFCTLADKDDQLYMQRSIRQKRNEATMKVSISPIVAIYVTTVMEHIAEYLLTAVAMTAEHEDTDYVRVKEVFLALIDDIQLGDVFHRMDLKDKMEKRAGFLNMNSQRASYLPAPPSSVGKRKSVITDHNETGSFLDITFDDLDLEYFDDNPRKSTVSTQSKVPEIIRPQSAMSYNSTALGSNRKSTFHLFKNNRNSFTGDAPRAASPVNNSAASIYDPDAPTAINFDDLIKSGETVKVSLTPNRLRSIEHKDGLSPPQPTWERRSTSSPRLSAINVSPARPVFTSLGSSSTNNRKSPSLPMTYSSSSSSSSSNHSSELDGGINLEYYQRSSIDTPKISTRPQTPSSPLSKKSFVISDVNRFENPRDAPKPPPVAQQLTELPATIPIVSPKLQPAPPPPSIIKSPTLKAVQRAPSVSSNKSSSASILSPPKAITPLAPLPKSTTTKSVNNNSNDSIESATSIPSNKSTISIQEPPIPRPSKSNSNTLNTNGMVIRRSSVSSKKSRENLRKLKEEALQKETAAAAAAAAIVADEPVPSTSQQISSKLMKEEEKEQKEPAQILTEEPQEITEESQLSTLSRQVRFDAAATAEQESAQSVSTIEVQESTQNEPSLLSGATPPQDPVPTAHANNNGVIPRKKAATLSPERPSSMVAKRASMVSNNRRRSMHESYATEKYHQDILLRQRISTVGPVSVSIKQWDDILKPEETAVIPPVAHRRSVLRQLRQMQQAEEQKQDGTNNAVLDKVLKFERASTLDQRVSHMPRRERFLYLQQDPSAIERKSSILTSKKPVINAHHKPVGIDQGVQTEHIVAKKHQKQTQQESEDDEEEEHGEVEGDEEWFLQDSEWDEQEEVAIVEWLLGE